MYYISLITIFVLLMILLFTIKDYNYNDKSINILLILIFSGVIFDSNLIINILFKMQ